LFSSHVDQKQQKILHLAAYQRCSKKFKADKSRLIINSTNKSTWHSICSTEWLRNFWMKNADKFYGFFRLSEICLFTEFEYKFHLDLIELITEKIVRATKENPIIRLAKLGKIMQKSSGIERWI
jgi:hypothetical protein